MRGAVIDDGARALLDNVAGSNDVEPAISQIEGRSARQAFRLRRVQHFDFDSHILRRSGVVGRGVSVSRGA